jgi:glyoxylase-like metal-dependent hydrolase (beta-lactamase superfamily II)
MLRYKVYPRGFGANSYILTADGKNAVVIDPSSYAVVREIEARGLVPAYVLLTHCHFDHVMFTRELQAMGAKVVCLDKEQENVNTDVDLFSLAGVERKPFTVDRTVSHGERFCLAGISFTAWSLPGHTSGSVCFLFTDKEGKKYLFTGDTLFCGTIGRTDFPTGSTSILRNSLKKLASLPGDYPIYAGHEEETTLDRERKTNPFLMDL